MNITWDTAKERINIEKHGVSFTQAAYVYQDPERLERYDSKHSVDENRWIIIGSAQGRVLFVIEAETSDPDTVRIVSARKATRKERKEYEYSKL
jgi:uncharacterized DUF497 family protein